MNISRQLNLPAKTCGRTIWPEQAVRRIARDKMGALLGIGYGNAKRFLERLNSYGVTRSEFDEALAQLGEQYG